MTARLPVSVLATDHPFDQRDPLSDVADAKSALWIFGNEAQGLKDLSQELASNRVQSVAIPMEGQTESLNLSVAAAIVMYAIGQ
jgi:tRNA G18 (ribose-2'-O)-methylase SpoU